MAAEVENQELQKEAVGEKSLWSQSGKADGPTDAGDSSKSAPGLSSSTSSSSNGIPAFSKEDSSKSSTELLGTGNIWSQKSALSSDGVWSTGPGGLDWSVSGEGISDLISKDGNKSCPWGGSSMQDSHGTTNALGLSRDFWKPGALSSYSSSGVTSGWGDSRSSNWGMPDLKTEFNKEGLPDKKIGSDQDRTKGIWNTVEERKVDPIGPVQRRSASLTELNVTFESSGLSSESVKFPSTGKVGLNDERSQPDGAEVSQQNREEMIAKMINSNEGWGKKPISQDTPWHMESAGTCLVEPLAAVAEDPATVKNDVFWNVTKEASATGWNSNPPAASTYEWAPDSDIGMWNGPPPPESVNPNMWTGPPKEANPVWLGGRSGMGQVGLDKGMLQTGVLPWGDRGPQGPSIEKLPKEFTREAGFDRMRGTDTWGQQPSRGAFDGNWPSGDGNLWGMPHPSDQQDGWGVKQAMNNFPSSGFGTGAKTDTIQKIGTWGDGSVTETGLWNQPQPLSNMQNPLQQLMDLGLKKEEAIFLLQNNMGVGMDKILELMKLQKEGEQPKGRIIRGKSMVEMPSDHFGQFQGGRNSGFQAGGRGLVFQPPVPNSLPPQMHMKTSGMQQSTGGWGNTYGRTPSIPLASSGVMQQQQPMPQMNPQMLQSLLHLQSVLQPLLLQRSQVQQNRNLTPMQKSLQIEQLNVYITDIKQRIDQVQLSFGPPPVAGAAPATMAPSDQQLGLDEGKMMQLLGQLKLDHRDFGALPHPPLGTVSELPMSDGKASIGGIPNLSMDQMAALIGSRWMNPESAVSKDKLSSGEILPDAWASMGQTINSGSKLGWPASGDFIASKGTRPPPPPGLGNCDKTDVFWNQHGMSRSTSWAPGEKLKAGLPGQHGMPSNWLMLKNIGAMADPGVLQKICLSYGPLQNFYYSKALGQVLACYINREDVLTALASISQSMHGASSSVRLIAEPVAAEEIGRLIDNTWTALPPVSTLFSAVPPGGKVNALRSGWGTDGM